MDGLKNGVHEKLDQMTEHVEKLEKDGKLRKNSRERQLLSGIKQLMKDMDQQNVLLMKKEEALQSVLETQYAETRAHMNSEVELMKKMMKKIEETEGASGLQDGKMKPYMERIKEAIGRYEETNR